MHPVTVESVLADIARLSIEERGLIRLRLNMAAYGVAVQAEVRQQFRDNAALQSRANDFGKHMTGYVIPPPVWTNENSGIRRAEWKPEGEPEEAPAYLPNPDAAPGS